MSQGHSQGQDHAALAGVSPEELTDALWKEVTEGFPEEQVLELEAEILQVKRRGRKNSRQSSIVWTKERKSVLCD